jgi:hypothetical protein
MAGSEGAAPVVCAIAAETPASKPSAHTTMQDNVFILVSLWFKREVPAEEASAGALTF